MVVKSRKLKKLDVGSFNHTTREFLKLRSCEKERECVRREWNARVSLHAVKYATIARRINKFTKGDQASKPLSAFGFEGTVNSLFFAMIFLAPSHYFPPHPHFPLPFLHAQHHKWLSRRRQPSLVPLRRSHLHLLKLLKIARLLSNAGDAVFVAQLVGDRHEHRCVKQRWDSDLLLDAKAQAVDVVDLRVRLFLFQLN